VTAGTVLFRLQFRQAHGQKPICLVWESTTGVPHRMHPANESTTFFDVVADDAIAANATLVLGYMAMS
jgi:hypothetical protein